MIISGTTNHHFSICFDPFDNGVEYPVFEDNEGFGIENCLIEHIDNIMKEITQNLEKLHLKDAGCHFDYAYEFPDELKAAIVLYGHAHVNDIQASSIYDQIAEIVEEALLSHQLFFEENEEDDASS